MRKYVKRMIDEFPVNIDKNQAVTIPETDNLFKVNRIKTMNKNKVELFHKTVVRGLFLRKRARPDILPTIAVLVVVTQELSIKLRAYKIFCLKWYVGVAFAVHLNFK